ncbi:hypothetical protein M948_20690 [Virgibacillus sp. CM-4]|uniref:hypothetical protein n=1 Tax=Virgibacillus sp. CM-4 TaxID=1354277 RepID=UPI00038884DD|nr:hypothetical protein [Virgibacillus sp. CM-4]EQB34801.1 hypothetical protein M948_20690 [Virgibacillus sp. CM-4]
MNSSSLIESVILVVILFSLCTHLINSCYSRASVKILRETRNFKEKVLYFFFPMFELIDYRRLVSIKINLKQKDYAEIESLRAAINSELERLKHFAPMGIIITLIVTTFFAIFSNLIPTVNGWNRSVSSLALQQKIKSLENQGHSNEDIANSLLNDFEVDEDFGELLQNRVNNFFMDILKTNFQVFLFVLIFLVLFWINHQIRISRLLKLKYIMDEL